MIAGLPGAGLGAMLYMILVAFLPFKLLFQRNFVKRQWQAVARLWVMFAGIMGVSAWQYGLLKAHLPVLVTAVGPVDMDTAMYITLAMLGLVAVALSALRFVYELVGSTRPVYEGETVGAVHSML
jgi:hypothetical protein